MENSWAVLPNTQSHPTPLFTDTYDLPLFIFLNPECPFIPRRGKSRSAVKYEIHEPKKPLSAA